MVPPSSERRRGDRAAWLLRASSLRVLALPTGQQIREHLGPRRLANGSQVDAQPRGGVHRERARRSLDGDRGVAGPEPMDERLLLYGLGQKVVEKRLRR